MRYFFDVQEDGVTSVDEDGVDCLSVEAAVREATTAVTGMTADMTEGGSLSVVVRDANGEVATLTVDLRIMLHRRA